MPMDNALNVSELLKRLGVVGNSKGSAPLLDALRLGITIADLSDLVPPLQGPIGGFSQRVSSGAGDSNKWTLNSRAAGGLRINSMMGEGTGLWRVWITDADPFVGSASQPLTQLAFGQTVESRVLNAPASPAIAPAGALILRSNAIGEPLQHGNWIGPAQFFNIESFRTSVAGELLTFTWREYPAALNP